VSVPVPAPQPDPGDDLQILAFFHYAMGAMIAMTALIPATYYAVGVTLSDPAYDQSVNENAQLLAFSLPFGWTLLLLGVGLGLGGLVAWGGLCMQRRRRFRLCVAAAIGSCLFVPLGTILGAASLGILTRPGIRELFEGENTSAG